jgi:hypothetical protein
MSSNRESVKRRTKGDVNELLEQVLAAHGGADQWRSVSKITARGHLEGLLPKRFAGNKLANFTFEVLCARQHTVMHGFPHTGQRAVFDAGHVRLETDSGDVLSTRNSARTQFFGWSGIRRNFHWDPLDVAYFAGYASWNYLTSPRMLTVDGVEVRNGKPWRERGEIWRRLDVRFPSGFHTHCPNQTFYIDDEGLIRRHDFVALPVGRWASAALYCDRHRQFDGLTFPTHRRVIPRGPRSSVLAHPILLDLNFDDIQIERSRS